MATVLFIDDDSEMRNLMKVMLTRLGHAPTLAARGDEGLNLAWNSRFDLIILDLMMPDMDGLTVLEEFKKTENNPVTVILTAFASIEKAVKATKLGAFDFITKPFKNDEIVLAMKNAAEHHRLLEENLRLKKSLRERYDFKNIIGKSEPMQQIFNLITQVAPRRSTILIQGESGTGKELVAKAIHAASGRADQPFVAINCGNIPSDLLESEIFGHVKGAYTGAVSAKKGLFELANGGTLFLDEVATISMEIQSKLLRVIQEREFRRLGGLENIKVDVRIIAAANTDLHNAVAQGTFRDDLYYRLNVIVLKLPPLRERTEDIPLLVEHFIKKYSEENDKEQSIIETAALKDLMDYNWPGNVRELENVIERSVVLAPGTVISRDLFPKNITARQRDSAFQLPLEDTPLKERVASFEKSLILAALQKTEWNQKKAARILSVNATTLSEKLKRLKIKTRTGV